MISALRGLAEVEGRGTMLYYCRQGPATVLVSREGRPHDQRGGKGTIGNRSPVIVGTQAESVPPGTTTSLRNYTELY